MTQLPNPKHHRQRGVILLLIPLTAVLVTPPNSTAGEKIREAGVNLSVRPEVLNSQTGPTLRYPVMTVSGSLTFGWLDISGSSIRYTVVEPPNKSQDSFEASRYAIREPRFNGTALSFRIPKRDVSFVYAPQEAWHSGRKGANSSNERQGTASIYSTLMNFDAVLAEVMPPRPPPSPAVVHPVTAPPAPKPVTPPSPPAIVLASPPGVDEGQVVELSERTVVIRGVAMDSSGIPVVAINGSPASMRPQTTQAAEFWSDPLPLHPGDNPFQISAVNAAHVETKLAFTIHYTPKAAPVNPKALAKAEIISLLQGAVPATRVAGIVKERGIKFAPTADDLKEIRDAGGDDDLIQAIQQAASNK
jgi:hypothetical protein